jgi:hypothetical protein
MNTPQDRQPALRPVCADLDQTAAAGRENSARLGEPSPAVADRLASLLAAGERRQQEQGVA